MTLDAARIARITGPALGLPTAVFCYVLRCHLLRCHMHRCPCAPAGGSLVASRLGAAWRIAAVDAPRSAASAVRDAGVSSSPEARGVSLSPPFGFEASSIHRASVRRASGSKQVGFETGRVRCFGTGIGRCAAHAGHGQAKGRRAPEPVVGDAELPRPRRIRTRRSIFRTVCHVLDIGIPNTGFLAGRTACESADRPATGPEPSAAAGGQVFHQAHRLGRMRVSNSDRSDDRGSSTAARSMGCGKRA